MTQIRQPEIAPGVPRVGVLRSTPAAQLRAAQVELAGTPVAEPFRTMTAAVGDLPTDRESLAMLSPEQGRALLSGLYAAEQQLDAALSACLAAAEADGWTEDTGLGTAAWLHDQHAQNRRVCRARVKRASVVAETPAVAEAMTAGAMSPDQAHAVAGVLKDLPDELGQEAREKATEHLIELAAEHDPGSLSTLSLHLLEVVAPDRADELEARRLREQEARAARERELYFLDDLNGSVRIRGKLPVAEAAGLRAVIDAAANGRRRALLAAAAPGQSPLPAEDAREVTEWQLDDQAQAWLDSARGADAGARSSTLMARLRADALVELAQLAANTGDLPAHGGDRPRVLVTIPSVGLARDAGIAKLADGTRISWARARQIMCDAGVLPVVLDGAGVPLDVGREQRFFTGAVRTAVLARDQGCAFPGCDRPPAACDIHHIVPWWNNGPTALSNGVALCPHHHGMVEPRPGSERQHWRIRLAEDGLPEFIPPASLDPARRARVHSRFSIRRRRITPRPDPDDPGD